MPRMPDAVPADTRAFRDREAIAQHGPPGARLTDALLNMIRKAVITTAEPAHLASPVWGAPIDLSARVTVPAAVTPYVTVVSFIVPPGRWASIQQYGVNVIDPTYTYDGSLLWRFRVNGLNLGDGLTDWGQQRGSIVNPRNISKSPIILREGWLIEFQVERAVVAAAPQDVEMTFIGHTWRLRNNYEGTAASVTAW